MSNCRLNRGRLVHMEYPQKDADLVPLIDPLDSLGAPSRPVYPRQLFSPWYRYSA